MENSRTRLGVIGMGPANMASTFALLRDVPDLRFQLQAICTRSPAVLQECLTRFGVPFGTTDARELAARDDVDVVCVFSPDHLHAEHCLTALEQGKHVVCTKPMVTRLEDARRLVAETRVRKVKFLVGQTMRFDRQFLMAKALLERGELGDLIAIESHYVHDMRPVFGLTPWRLHAPQDFMFGGCAHCLDILRALGGDLESVHAIARKGNLTAEYPLADNFFLNVRFKSGAIGRVSGLYGIVHPPMPMMQFGLFGSRGSLQAEFTDNQPGQVRVVLDRGSAPRPTVTVFEPERDLSAYGHGATVTRYMRHFQECLDADREPSPSVLDGAKSVAACAAAWESVQTGAEVKIENDF